MSKKVVLPCGTTSLVSDEDYELVSRFSWHIQSKGYVAGSIGSGYIMLHRFLMGAKAGMVVHHRDGDPLNNTRENLVLTTYSTNNHSRHGVKKFPFIGIFFDKEGQKFVASIKMNGKNFKIGRYDEPIEAASAYDKKAIEIYGDAAMTNERFLKSLLAKLKKLK